MKFLRNYNFGNPQVSYGIKSVVSEEVYPTTITATASGTVFPVEELANYGVFVAAQTSASTDSIILPDSIPVGAQFLIQFNSSCGIQCPSGSSVLLNNVAAPAEGVLAANSTAVIRKVSATRIVFYQVSSLGAVSAIVPA